MTDNEIIKALECAEGIDIPCLECSYKTVAPFPECRLKCVKDALDLINRQKAEIERLKNDIDEANIIERENEIQSIEENKENSKMFLQAIKQAKSEAIKEFAERLEDKIFTYINYVDVYGVIILNRIYRMMENIVKQMTEGEK